MIKSLRPQPKSKTTASFVVVPDSKFIAQVRSNVKSDLIEITEDKLEVILLKHLRSCDTRWSWIAPLSVFLSLLLAIITTTFVDSLQLKADTWHAIFILLCAASGGWLLVSLIRMLWFWNSASIAFLITTIKKADGV